jgi:hypothetical protein
MSKNTLKNTDRKNKDRKGNYIMYRVKYNHPKFGWQYGVARIYPWDEECHNLAKVGQVIIDNSIFPTSCIVHEDKLVRLETIFVSKSKTPVDDLGFLTWGHSEFYDYCSLHGLAHKIRSESNPNGEIFVNDLFSIGVADGCATYVVTKTGRSKCTVEWRGFDNMDRYTDHYFGWGRMVSKTDLRPYVIRGKLFGANKKKVNKIQRFIELSKEFENFYGLNPNVAI